MALTTLSSRKAAALVVGAFALGAGSVALVDGGERSAAYAQNLSDQVTPEIQDQYAPGFAEIVDRVSPAVVSIQVRAARPQTSSFRGFEGTPFERFFEDFEERLGGFERRRGNRGNRNRRRFSLGQGSGFIISANGYIVTNGHVVDDADQVDVVLQDGSSLTAEVVGVDEKTDLALVKVSSDEDLPFVTFASREVKVGDWVVAVGNPFGLGGTVTAGIVSARGREIGAGPYDDFIQIDAPINRGNSGGPTFNLRGNVVGVNTAIFSPSGGSVGIGFAIPATIAENVIEDLKDDGSVTRGYLGVQIQNITPEIAESLGRSGVQGALVTEPQDGSPADEAGVRPGDAILSVDGEPVDGPRDLARTISGRSPGETVTLNVWREGAEREIAVELARLPNATASGSDANRRSRQVTPSAMDSLGMTLAPAASVGLDSEGLAVVEVDPNGVAAENGVRVGDILLQAAGRPLNEADDLDAGVEAAQSEGRRNVLLKLRSGDNTRFVALPADTDRS